MYSHVIQRSCLAETIPTGFFWELVRDNPRRLAEKTRMT